jgi:hypothetical protein
MKLVGKQTNTVTTSWSLFLDSIGILLSKLINNMKIEAVKQGAADAEVEIEIDNRFFKQKFVPLVHQFVSASIES